MAKRTRSTGSSKAKLSKPAANYRHPEATSPLRPDVGTQPQFKKRKPPATYRYDSSLSPALDWDGQNPARERGETLIAKIAELAATVRNAGTDAARIEAAEAIQVAAGELRALGKPFLNWAGKAERLSFNVPTLPLFVHERLSTRAIIDTLTGHRRQQETQGSLFDLFGDPDHPITDQILKAYEHRDKWVNRMILGDSLTVMNSLLHYENLAGQVQMIYIDPPYGVKYGSNFQPFVRKRDVKNNDDEDFTREPEMVKAYRDTWELGLHSYLTYLRDRLSIARELLARSGSVFVQISDENLHHVRELMDELFGANNFVSQISFAKTSGSASDYLGTITDYILWFSKDLASLKFRATYAVKSDKTLAEQFRFVELPDGTVIKANESEILETGEAKIGKRFMPENLTGQGEAGNQQPYVFNKTTYRPNAGRHWSTTNDGIRMLEENNRLFELGNRLAWKRYLSDFPVTQYNNLWTDTAQGGRSVEKVYVVQTSIKAVERCLLMATDPGDLVIDPTCGSGTTAYVAEQWGRRWITIDTSRVPLALARQRLLTASFSWHELKDHDRGPVAGFVYKRKQNRKGEEVGGIVPHITLKSIANNEPPAEEVLVDRPEQDNDIVRVTGPFTFEATIPTALDWEQSGEETESSKPVAAQSEADQSFPERMLEILRQSPVLRLDGNKTIQLTNIRRPAKTLSLNAEALVKNGTDKPVAFVFGPENGAVSERLVYNAAKEGAAKNYTHLYVIGFAIQPNARTLVDQSDATMGIAATYVQATPDLLMGDLLKNMRSSQIFSVCGLPEIKVTKLKPTEKGGAAKYQVELLGMDVFDPVTMETDHRKGNDVPAWFLDVDYNGLCFHVGQAFFPRTSAWENLKKELKGEYDDSLWDHLAGTTSAPFEAGEHGQIAVKVIDDRGNELVVVQALG